MSEINLARTVNIIYFGYRLFYRCLTNATGVRESAGRARLLAV